MKLLNHLHCYLLQEVEQFQADCFVNHHINFVHDTSNMLRFETHLFYMVCFCARHCQIDCSDINYMGGANQKCCLVNQLDSLIKGNIQSNI